VQGFVQTDYPKSQTGSLLGAFFVSGLRIIGYSLSESSDKFALVRTTKITHTTQEAISIHHEIGRVLMSLETRTSVFHPKKCLLPEIQKAVHWQLMYFSTS